MSAATVAGSPRRAGFAHAAPRAVGDVGERDAHRAGSSHGPRRCPPSTRAAPDRSARTWRRTSRGTAGARPHRLRRRVTSPRPPASAPISCAHWIASARSKLLLVREVQVEGAVRGAGGADDVVDARGVEPAFGEDAHPRVEQLAHRLATLRPQLRGPRPAFRAERPRRAGRVARRDDLYASAMSLPGPALRTIAEAARRFADRTAYRHAAPAGRSPTPTSTASPTRSRSGSRREGVRPGDVVGLVLPAGPEYLLTVRRRGQARRDHRRRQRPALRARTRRHPRRRAAPARRHHGRRARGRVRRHRAGATLRASGARRRPRALGRSRPAGRDHLHVGHDRPAEGRALLQPPARVHHPDRRRRHLGHRRPLVQRHVVRAPRLHDQAHGKPAARRDHVHHGALARAARARAARPRTHDDRRGRADAARADAARSRVRRLRPVVGAVHRRRRVVRSRRVSPRRRVADSARRLATRYSCTEAGIGLGTAFDDPDEDAIISVGRPHASVELSLRDDDGDPVGRRRDRRGVPALPRGHVGLLARPRADAPPRSPRDGFVRTGDLGWIDDRGRLRLVGRSKEMYVRGGYNVYPVEVESVLSTHPDVAAVAVVPRADDVMGEIGVAAVVPRDPARPPSLADLRAFAAPHSPRTSSPRRSTSSTLCRSPSARRSTAGCWWTQIAQLLT